MIIDKIDLAILRYMERFGYLLYPLIDQLRLTSEEISDRIDKLEKNYIITNYKASIFIPPFLGGNWTWGCILATAKNRGQTIEQIVGKIPFISEIWLNSNLPENLGHNCSFIFYSKDFDAELKFIQEISDISYLMAYRISNYSFPMARIFSNEEKQLLKNIVLHPIYNNQQLAEICQKTTAWVKAKKEKLVYTPSNPEGVIFTLPEIQYSNIENFAHCHFVIECSNNLELLLEELKLSGFELVQHGKTLYGYQSNRHKYAQLEVDVWGFNDFLSKKTHLNSFKEIKILGIIFAEKMQVVSDWAVNLIQD